MRDVAAREGYPAATVARVIAHAGVSRSTFYDYFSDREDCLLAALADIQERLLRDVGRAVRSEAPEHAMNGAIRALIGFASSEPTLARLLMSEPAAAGSRALDTRDQRIAEIERVIEEAYQQAPPSAPIPDVSSRIAIGAVCRMIAARLRRGEQRMSGPLTELFAWIKSYEQPAEESRWRTLAPLAPPPPWPYPADTPLRAPARIDRGEPGLTREELIENARRRIVFAAAQVSTKKGYSASTVAEITELAGVERRAFYRVFADKREAFGAVRELLFRHLIAVTAGAFATGRSWPERVWRAGRAFAQFIEQDAALARIAFIESQAGGPAATARSEDLIRAFTIFLQEGYRDEAQNGSPTQPPPSSLALEAIVTAVFELGYRQAREGRDRQLSGLLAHAVFISLAPFLGAVETNRFLDQKIGPGRERDH